MCRLLGYFGSPVPLEDLLYKPPHSLVNQSYQPKEMTAGLLNADGFGLGWYHSQKKAPPYLYKNILPIWSDINLPSLSRYVESNCLLAYVRSATPPLGVEFSNCQPFNYDQLLFIHNGFVHNFRTTLYRPIRNSLSDRTYQLIHGTTDSEHIFALIVEQLVQNPDLSLKQALSNTLQYLSELAYELKVYFSANIILSNGKELVASRYANRHPIPSLYWLKQHPLHPEGVIIASEPLFSAEWNSLPDHSILRVGENLEIELDSCESRHPRRPLPLSSEYPIPS